MKVQHKAVGTVCVLEIEGEIDAEHCPKLKKVLAAARNEKSSHFIIDFKKVGFIDSTGLGILISLMRHLKENGGQLRLVGLQDQVRSIFEITRLFRVFDLSKDVESALKEIREQI